MSGPVPVVTIDGPTGSGKGTISKALAERLHWHLLDSGALYRLLAVAARRRGVPLDDPTRLAELARRIEPALGPQGGLVLLEGAELSDELRSETTGEAASKLAQFAAVREALLPRQRAFARPPGLVADGRDMGTTVFPDALLKVFLTASAEERAMRRYKQLKEKGIGVSLPDLSRDIAERDRRDATRPVAPLRPAHDAHVIDSTGLAPADVLERILTRLEEAGVQTGKA